MDVPPRAAGAAPQSHLAAGPLFGPLLSFGGWITLTSVISPLMVTFDRFVVGTLTGISAVAYYATPYEVLSRLLNIHAALAGVLFRPLP